MYRPVFSGKKITNKKHYHHALATKATPVPMDENGKRTSNGWELFYDNWEAGVGSTFHSATGKIPLLAIE
jgi:hypothetical protein